MGAGFSGCDVFCFYFFHHGKVSKVWCCPYLCEGHLGDDGQHDLLSLGGVGVLLVLVQPGLGVVGYCLEIDNSV